MLVTSGERTKWRIVISFIPPLDCRPPRPIPRTPCPSNFLIVPLFSPPPYRFIFTFEHSLEISSFGKLQSFLVLFPAKPYILLLRNFIAIAAILSIFLQERLQEEPNSWFLFYHFLTTSYFIRSIFYYFGRRFFLRYLARFLKNL